MYHKITVAILVTGGDYGTGGVYYSLSSVELLHSDGSPWCSLPQLPEGRAAHTQTGLEACGGDPRSAYPLSSCVKLSGGSWTPSHQMVEPRYDHSSWASPAGTLLMGGGYYTRSTTELLDTTTGDSLLNFPLKYDTQ